MKLHKPSNRTYKDWESILDTEAGQGFIAEQVGGTVDPEISFVSDNVEHHLYSDGSLLTIEDNFSFLYPDVQEALSESDWRGVKWEDARKADKELLRHCYGDEAVMIYCYWGGLV